MPSCWLTMYFSTFKKIQFILCLQTSNFLYIQISGGLTEATPEWNTWDSFEAEQFILLLSSIQHEARTAAHTKWVHSQSVSPIGCHPTNVRSPLLSFLRFVSAPPLARCSWGTPASSFWGSWRGSSQQGEVAKSKCNYALIMLSPTLSIQKGSSLFQGSHDPFQP